MRKRGSDRLCFTRDISCTSKEDEKMLDSRVATASRAVSQWLASKLPQRYNPDWMDVRMGAGRAQCALKRLHHA